MSRFNLFRFIGHLFSLGESTLTKVSGKKKRASGLWFRPSCGSMSDLCTLSPGQAIKGGRASSLGPLTHFCYGKINSQICPVPWTTGSPAPLPIMKLHKLYSLPYNAARFRDEFYSFPSSHFMFHFPEHTSSSPSLARLANSKGT